MIAAVPSFLPDLVGGETVVVVTPSPPLHPMGGESRPYSCPSGDGSGGSGGSGGGGGEGDGALLLISIR